jgi:hypothetical protein
VLKLTFWATRPQTFRDVEFQHFQNAELLRGCAEERPGNFGRIRLDALYSQPERSIISFQRHLLFARHGHKPPGRAGLGEAISLRPNCPEERKRGVTFPAALSTTATGEFKNTTTTYSGANLHPEIIFKTAYGKLIGYGSPDAQRTTTALSRRRSSIWFTFWKNSNHAALSLIAQYS